MVRPEVKKKQQMLVEAARVSRKARKKLEQVVLRKKHKVNRQNILEELKRVQLQPDQLNQLHSTASMQTKGLKRFSTGDDVDVATGRRKLTDIERAEQCLDAANLISRKRRKLRKNLDEQKPESSSEDTDAIPTDSDEEELGDSSDQKNKHDDDQLTQQSVKTDEKSSPIKPTCDDAAQICDSTIKAETMPPTKSELKSKTVTQVGEKKPAVFVHVNRVPEVEESRNKLPIIGEEYRIMDEIQNNDVVIISGETGSGKTTQLPQFLYEAGYTLSGKLIGITEPRRVAAVTMSERVAYEMNLKNNEVAYQIRFAGTVTEQTRIKFMTDGVLMRECREDFLLSNYSVIIIDEAHERSVFSDILIGLLSRIVPQRAKQGNPLKLIIMSATLRVTDFTSNSFLFPKIPPTINIESRQYPVTIQFAKRTPQDYLLAAYKKVCAIHRKMPRGGILVFVTSQMDVKALCARLRKKPLLHCLGLFAMLPLDKQQLVFKDPPEGSRLCVIATNVAETSITIPNIKYVVDTGLEKRKIYNLLTGVSKFVTSWTSKSSAEQRTGRAGRIGPGYCYRLYSSAVFTNDLPEHAEPQILQKPVDDVLLQMKAMNIDNVVNFPFPTKPPVDALKVAEKKLVMLGALDDTKFSQAKFEESKKCEYTSRLTPLGKAMSKFAVSARCSKMIVLAPDYLLTHVVALVSALTVREMFIIGNQFMDIRKKWVGHGESKLLGDFMLMLRAISVAEKYECKNEQCLENGLRTKAMLEIDKLRRQLTKDINSNCDIPIQPDECLPKKLKDSHVKVLRQILLASFSDHVAKRLPDGHVKESITDQTKSSKKLKDAYECTESDEPVYIERDSILHRQNHEYIIYKELYKGNKKTYMRDVAVIDPAWLPFYAHKMCRFKDTNAQPPRFDPKYDQIVCKRETSYGSLNWPLGLLDVPADLVDTRSTSSRGHTCPKHWWRKLLECTCEAANSLRLASNADHGHKNWRSIATTSNV